MGPQELLQFFSRKLAQYNIPFLLTGGMATGYYGFPRSTHDIDFIVEVGETSLKNLRRVLGDLGKNFMCDMEQLDYVMAPTLVTAYHFPSTMKIDFWIVKTSNFTNEWKRRKQKQVLGQPITLVSAEDLILTKLAWCKEVYSERHLRDSIGIWHVQKGKLDKGYLQQKAKELHILDLLKTMTKSKPISY
ncbi:nucleotidyl transferase AbiEii/AbiGii toxin family protein [Candidatus Gottesmanbacteria bacterium]|nr:nucleotidyl transferase AbiEii/AbiGii toxin family protein [Candidatus Gottesmanbacteria bacterium]